MQSYRKQSCYRLKTFEMVKVQRREEERKKKYKRIDALFLQTASTSLSFFTLFSHSFLLFPSTKPNQPRSHTMTSPDPFLLPTCAAAVFKDTRYQVTMDMIYRVHSGLGNKLSIPSLAIVGDQSAGKSSVLVALSKLPFPRSEGMCTRYAIQVNMRYNPNLENDVLYARIDGEDKFNLLYASGSSPSTFPEVIENANKCLLDGKMPVSKKVLEVTLSGPNQSPLTLIDLPGYVYSVKDNEDPNLPTVTEEINSRYIEDPRTIILAVMQASVEFENSKILGMAKASDPLGQRTVPIITKVDMMVSFDRWMSVIRNQSKKMKHGYLVMSNPPKLPGEEDSWEISRHKEHDLFFQPGKWSDIDDSRKGRQAVTTFLSELLFHHISNEMPSFKVEVRDSIQGFKRELEALGTAIADKETARKAVASANLAILRKVDRYLVADYDPQYIAAYWEKPVPTSSEETDEDGNIIPVKNDEDSHFVRAALHRLYHKYRATMMDPALRTVSNAMLEHQISIYKGNDPSGFVSFTTFKNIYNGHYLPAWREVTDAYVSKMRGLFADGLRGLIKHSADGATGKVVTRIFSQFSRLQEEAIKLEVNNIFEDEQTPFTLNRQYMETIHKERSKNYQIPPLPAEQSIAAGSSSGKNVAGSPPSSPLPQTPEGDSEPPQTTSDWNDLLTRKAVVPCLIAYNMTALERIIDKVVMQTIERHMVRKIGDYFEMVQQVTDEDLECMVESTAIKDQREQLQNKIDEYEKLLDEL